MVCKQSGAMHARFHGSSWAKKTKNQSDRLPSSINKAGERFRSKVAKLSVGHTWSLIRKVGPVNRCFVIILSKKRNGSLSKKLKCLNGVNNVYVDDRI